ncbi:MAG TPA: hypothetical protein G4O14_02845, partial [Anaerolineae bacterium]|nr:hypothetical protein [Anaerolineae bacterium]
MPSMRKNVFKAFEQGLRDLEQNLPDVAIDALTRAIQHAHGDLDRPFMQQWSPKWGPQPVTTRDASSMLVGALNPTLRAMVAATPVAERYEDLYQNLVMGVLENVPGWSPSKGLKSAAPYLLSKAYHYASGQQAIERAAEQPVTAAFGAATEDYASQMVDIRNQVDPRFRGIEQGESVTPYKDAPWYHTALAHIPQRGLRIPGLPRPLTPFAFQQLIPFYEQGVSNIDVTQTYDVYAKGPGLAGTRHVSGAKLKEVLQLVHRQIGRSGLISNVPAPPETGSTIDQFESMLVGDVEAQQPYWGGPVQVSPTLGQLQLGGTPLPDPGWSLRGVWGLPPETGGNVPGQSDWDYHRGHLSYIGGGAHFEAEIHRLRQQ